MISHHRLEGKFVSLVRPLAVLEKKVRADKRVLADMGNEDMVGMVKRARREEPVTPRKGKRELDFSSSPPQMTPVKPRPVKTTLKSVDENGTESHSGAGDEVEKEEG